MSFLFFITYLNISQKNFSPSIFFNKEAYSNKESFCSLFPISRLQKLSRKKTDCSLNFLFLSCLSFKDIMVRAIFFMYPVPGKYMRDITDNTPANGMHTEPGIIKNIRWEG